MTVDEMLSRISSRELSEWIAYCAIEPFGEYRADLRTGILASTMANIHRAKDAKAFTPDDFMPRFEREEKKVDLFAKVMGVFSAFKTKKRV